MARLEFLGDEVFTDAVVFIFPSTTVSFPLVTMSLNKAVRLGSSLTNVSRKVFCFNSGFFLAVLLPSHLLKGASPAYSFIAVTFYGSLISR